MSYSLSDRLMSFRIEMRAVIICFKIAAIFAIKGIKELFIKEA